MHLDGVLTNDQFFGDLLVAQPTRDQGQDLLFPFAEGIFLARHGVIVPQVGVFEKASGCPAYPVA